MNGHSLSVGFRIFVAMALLVFAVPAFADFVTPSDRATSGVHVRQRASASSPSLGILRPGDQAELLQSVPRWYRIKLPDNRIGYVGKAWTEIQTATRVAGDFTVHVVDVGTGLAVAVQGPDFFLIFDGGSNDDLGRGEDNRFLAYLKKVFPDLRKVDHVILSPHRDHVELLPDILRTYEVKNVWDSGAVNDICGYRAFIVAVSEEPGVTYRSARYDAGSHPVSFSRKRCYGQIGPEITISLAHGPTISNEPITLGQGATLTFLHSDGSDHGREFNRNSLVAQLILGGKRILLMGDAEAGGRAFPTTVAQRDSIEAKLIDCCSNQLRSDAMIVGHHGSMTSSRKNFLNHVAARIFVISSGPVKYGSVVLPDSAVVEELSRRGRVFRTDIDDGACAAQEEKLGPDEDGRAGGCDHVRILIPGGGGNIAADYWRGID